MEIKFDNVCYKSKMINTSFKMNKNKINGVYNYNTFLKVLTNPRIIDEGNIFIDGKFYRNFDSKIIAIIDKEKDFYTSKVIDEILFYAKIKNYKSHISKKK